MLITSQDYKDRAKFRHEYINARTVTEESYWTAVLLQHMAREGRSAEYSWGCVRFEMSVGACCSVFSVILIPVIMSTFFVPPIMLLAGTLFSLMIIITSVALYFLSKRHKRKYYHLPLGGIEYTRGLSNLENAVRRERERSQVDKNSAVC